MTQPATFGIHFLYHDFTSAANIRATSLSEVLRNNKFGCIKDMHPGLALNYIKGLSPTYDLSATLAGSFLDYPFKDDPLSGKKSLLLEGDMSIRGKMFDNDHWVSPYLQAGVGISKYKGHWGALLPVGIGLQVNPASELHVLINAQYRFPVTTATVNHHFYYSIGIAGVIGKKKIAKPAPVPVEVITFPADRDNDGIVDTADLCPDVPGQAIFNGCPDSDGDGIQDKEDACPKVPGLARYKGCPIPDTDNDGINDEEDKCIDVPGIPLYAGCPPPDRDQDGVEDKDDKCPDLYGSKANGGCPEIKEVVRKRVNVIAEHILFETGSFRLLSSSHTALNEMVKLMQENPSMNLNIEGHTDNTGTPPGNDQLSEARSKAVFEYLVKAGVAVERLKFKGYGQDNPIADNATKEGRAKNRRVELKVW